MVSVAPIEGGSSLELHESQSRFWENALGQVSLKLISPLIRKQVNFASQTTDDELLFNNLKAYSS
ncbi:hypothetical protein [Candidatus Nitrosocosmicus sp. FF01]|uniref:hypothetical protein n=1 Tax=Candidatus Nitrosocosmicus sp. FF01 TaxID=3397670 RepID=UPI0039EBA3A7